MTRDNSILYEGHLGGHAWITHTDQGALEYIKNKYNIETMIDIGCGPGGQVKLAESMDISATGIDGDPRLLDENPDIWLCDFTKESCEFDEEIDLAWSCEFLEHVEEQYIPNYIKSFQSAKYCFATHALPGTESFEAHHVNCKDDAYWINVFEEYGFTYDADVTLAIREASTMTRDFVRNSGQFFYKTR
jgi:cyclopropane fatty-acyl-phospholipid synthase-like methyltransferase